MIDALIIALRRIWYHYLRYPVETSLEQHGLSTEVTPKEKREAVAQVADLMLEGTLQQVWNLMLPEARIKALEEAFPRRGGGDG